MTYAQAIAALRKPYISRKSHVVLSSHVGLIVAAALTAALAGTLAHSYMSPQRACNYDAPHCPVQSAAVPQKAQAVGMLKDPK